MGNAVAEKKKHRLRLVGIVVLAVLLIAYWVAVNLMVSAALVPSFMERLDAFQEVTEVSYSQQVHTSDIQENRKAALAETRQWLQTAEREDWTLTSRDGYRLVAAVFPREDSHRWAVVLHGYTGWKEEMFPYACRYAAMGYQVLAPDLRCQGQSEGDFIGMGYTDRLDVLDWIERILEKDPKAEIVLHGQSMGGACALMMSGMEELPAAVKAVVSDCAYTDAYSMFRQDIRDWFHLPAFPLVDSANLALQIRGGYDIKKASALEAVRRKSVPVLLIHGDTDRMIPVEMAYALYDAAAGEKKLMIVEGAGHAQARDKDPSAFDETVAAFLSKYVGT